MPKGDLHDPTFAGNTVTNAGTRASVVPCLSILWHPDLQRVGELAPLGNGETRISRLEPVFSQPGSRDAEPLTTTHLSRAPSLVIRVLKGSQISVGPGDADVAVELAGERLQSPRTLALSELDAGIPIALGKRVALCLHLATLPTVRTSPLGMIGDSEKMRLVRDMILRLSDLDVPVLIRGETGSGKEMVARALVAQGSRKQGPFVAVNMATISATTAEAQLFGHERGAFTGADKARSGFFVEADGGTLFLDEVGLTPLDVQAMLLRTLETGEVRGLGSGKPRRVDVRVIAATDVDLGDAITARSFSPALFHRLAGFQIEIPPLRERRQDIGPLLLHFLREELSKTGEVNRLEPDVRKQWLPADVVARLAMADWPGNVRSLANAARQIAISSRGQPHGSIDPVVLNVVTTAASGTSGRSRTVREESRDRSHDEPSRPPSGITPEVLLAALKRNKFEPGATAAELRISRNSLYDLIERHPTLRKATAIPAEEIARMLRDENGDADRAAERLQISKRAMALRMRQVK